MKTSEILKELRKSKGFTQKQLGERLNIGQATVASYENGTREPHVFSLQAYADFFECSVDYLIGRADDFGNVTVNGGYENVLTPEERELLAEYQKLDYGKKMRVMAYIQLLTEQ